MVTTVKNKLLDDEDRELAERKAWAGSIAELEAEAEKELKPLDDAVAAATERLATAQIAFKEADEAHRTALFDRANASNLIGRRRNQLEAQLLATAAPEINAFIAEVAAESGDLQLSGGPHSITFRRARLTALGRARTQVLALKFLPLSRSDLQAKLGVIRGALAKVTA